MPSKVLRRSGNAVVHYCDQLLKWRPAAAYIVGVGGHHEEVAVMREAWPDVVLYGFEPNPQTYEGARDTFPGRLFPYAVSNKQGKQTLHYKPDWKDGGSLFEPVLERDRRRAYLVEVTTLDDMLPLLRNGSSSLSSSSSSTNSGSSESSLSSPSSTSRDKLLWLDCEGSEFDVLRGGNKFIDFVAVVNVELTCVPRGNGWAKPHEVHSWLKARGFLHCWQHSVRPSIGQVDAVYVHRTLFRSDACAIPASLDGYLEMTE